MSVESVEFYEKNGKTVAREGGRDYDVRTDNIGRFYVDAYGKKKYVKSDVERYESDKMIEDAIHGGLDLMARGMERGAGIIQRILFVSFVILGFVFGVAHLIALFPVLFLPYIRKGVKNGIKGLTLPLIISGAVFFAFMVFGILSVASVITAIPVTVGGVFIAVALAAALIGSLIYLSRFKKSKYYFTYGGSPQLFFLFPIFLPIIMLLNSKPSKVTG